MKRFVAVAAGFAALGAASVVAQPSGPPPPDGLIAVRQSEMELQAGVLAGMKAAVEANQDVKPFAAAAKALVSSASVIPILFPTGTQQGHNTKAKPNIWTDWSGFQQSAGNLHAQAQKLVQFADANDKAGFAAQFKAVGEACGSCHRHFKER